MALRYASQELDLHLAINGSVRRLAAIRRYSSIPCNRIENVAEHTGFAALYAYWIGLDLQRRGYPIDMAVLLETIVVHDLDEAMSGDIMRGFKYRDPEILAAIKRASGDNMKDLVTEYGEHIGEQVHAAWADKDGLEHEIREFVDFICVFAYCREEVLMGNEYMDKVIHDAHIIVRDRWLTSEGFRPYYYQLFPYDHHSDLYRAVPSEDRRQVLNT